MRENLLPMVSIIVPIYNAEQTIIKCVNSLINQTYLNREIILVNNNSTDETENICYKLCERNRDIRLYKCKKKGVSAARNFGLDKAIGKYIIFVDSDDWLSENAVESMVFQTWPGRLSAIQVYIVHNESVGKKEKYQEIYSAKEYIEAILKNKLHGSVNGCLLEKKVIGELKFDEKTGFMEDFLFLLVYLTRIKEVKIVGEKYFYRQYDNNSTCRKDNILQQILEIDYTLKRIENILVGIGSSEETLGFLVKKKANAVEWKLSFVNSFRDAKRLLADNRIQAVIESVLKEKAGIFYTLYYRMLNKKFSILFWVYLRIRKCKREVKNILWERMGRRENI